MAKTVTTIQDVIKDLGKKEKLVGKALKATVSDMRRRVPGKVADEVRTVYNIKKSEIVPGSGKAAGQKKAGRTVIKGETVAELVFVYKGRPLTPTHFGMSPKEPTMGKNGRWKQVSARVKKGKRKSWGRKIFLVKTGAKDGSKIPYITFMRTTKKPYPITVKKTVSLPQMVSNRDVMPGIEKQINELLDKRLTNNVRRFLG
jgi:hypothetical protein